MNSKPERSRKLDFKKVILMAALSWCIFLRSTLSSDAMAVQSSRADSQKQESEDAHGPGVACNSVFPYSVEEFMRRLMLLADEPNPWKVRQKFEQVFEVKFSHFHGDDFHRFYQWMKVGCEWYAAASVFIDNGMANKAYARSIVDISAYNMPVLEFKYADKTKCLTSEMMTWLLRADGWEGGVAKFEATISLAYRKPDATIDAQLGAPLNPERQMVCVESIKIRYTK
jgi:hypothetical protein